MEKTVRKRRGKDLSQNTPHQQQSATNSSTNRFGGLKEQDLSDCDSEMSFATKSSKRSRLSLTNPTSKAKKQNSSIPLKPPPLTIVDQAFTTIKLKIDTLLNFKKDLCEFRLNSMGTQIFPATTEVFTKIKKFLIDGNYFFFTHDLREEQMSKFVLHGYLPSGETDLMFYLKEQNIIPVQVKILKIKNKKFTDHAVFLIYFLKNQKVKISQLREVKIINHIRVRWEYYSNRFKGPIQCSNCQSFGHGGKNCHLRPRCIRCSDFHKSINCPKLIDTKTMQTRTRIPDQELKCSNCGQNHAANYSKCEKRKEVIERRQKYRVKTQNVPQNSFRPAPELNDFNFPHLNSNSQHHEPKQSTNSSLFSTSELMQIFTELMTKMQSASTKLQQIQVLGEIVIKYASR